MENNGVAQGPARPGLFENPLPYPSWWQFAAPAATVLRGRAAISSVGMMLAELSRLSGQSGAMDSLDHFMNAPSALAKTPYLVLVGLRPGVAAHHARAQDVQGAVLLYEYRFAGIGTRVFATDDAAGERTAIAPPENRREVVETACRTLLDQGAQVVLVSYAPPGEAEAWPIPKAIWPPAYWMARRSRDFPRYLALQDTFDATLATLGHNTRRNLIRYRRKAEGELGAVFVPHVELGLDEFLAMNRASTNPIAESMIRWRHDRMVLTSTSRTAPMLYGVKAADGRWLSLIGGRRRRGVTEIDWQLNLAGLPQHSLSTVMRSYMLEHEVALGTRKLVFEGGTPHSIRHSFTSVAAEDVIVHRRSLIAWAIRKAARWITPKKNFLGQLLHDPDLNWNRW